MDDSHPNLKIELQGLRGLAAVEESEFAQKSSPSWKSKQPILPLTPNWVSDRRFSQTETHMLSCFSGGFASNCVYEGQGERAREIHRLLGEGLK